MEAPSHSRPHSSLDEGAQVVAPGETWSDRISREWGGLFDTSATRGGASEGRRLHAVLDCLSCLVESPSWTVRDPDVVNKIHTADIVTETAVLDFDRHGFTPRARAGCGRIPSQKIAKMLERIVRHVYLHPNSAEVLSNESSLITVTSSRHAEQLYDATRRRRVRGTGRARRGSGLRFTGDLASVLVDVLGAAIAGVERGLRPTQTTLPR